jgi:hypothetical protein
MTPIPSILAPLRSLLVPSHRIFYLASLLIVSITVLFPPSAHSLPSLCFDERPSSRVKRALPNPHSHLSSRCVVWPPAAAAYGHDVVVQCKFSSRPLHAPLCILASPQSSPLPPLAMMSLSVDPRAHFWQPVEGEGGVLHPTSSLTPEALLTNTAVPPSRVPPPTSHPLFISRR